MEKSDPANTGRSIKWGSHFGTVWQFLKRLNIETIWLNNSTLLGIYSGVYIHTNTCTWMFTTASFIIAKRCQQLKHPPTDEQINRTWYSLNIYRWVLFSNKKIRSNGTWKNLENILLSERSQSQKTTYCLVPFIWNAWNRQTWERK